MTVQQAYIGQLTLGEDGLHAEQPAEVRYGIKDLLGFGPGQVGQAAQTHTIGHVLWKPERTAEPHTLINTAGGVQRREFDGLRPWRRRQPQPSLGGQGDRQQGDAWQDQPNCPWSMHRYGVLLLLGLCLSLPAAS